MKGNRLAMGKKTLSTMIALFGLQRLWFVFFPLTVYHPVLADTWKGATHREQLWVREYDKGPVQRKKLIPSKPSFLYVLAPSKEYYQVYRNGAYHSDLTLEEARQINRYNLDRRTTITFDDLIRFDRSRLESIPETKTLKQNEIKIKNLLLQCLKLGNISENNEDFQFIHFVSHPSLRARPDPDDSASEHRFSGAMMKCAQIVYPHDTSIHWLYRKPYNVGDFNFNQFPTAIQAKQAKIYEKLYLHIKAAGLVRRMLGAYYPKTLLRAHAKKTGLDKYIIEREQKAGTTLNHDELAAQYFGDYDAWLKNLEEYINQYQ